ncbi:CmpA/NrtA family ABC transporter substrate-binding protein [Marinobacterium rhizophilum]|uniref:ABC transporter substrate-binding protein n=1 Tax=Marinobacterium rhizophilum TaxID=420402 RepID=A0ABY5HNP7_9GAMM|nr:CmpA/NrtA family ABC transporter substrate-binding protein [Marinobacterium rhizophilum]UTW13574.1 ABC transporter substrate-binding protein [Marinobacterium rhizophilum]
MSDLTLPSRLAAPEKPHLTLGFVPLIDACPLIVALELGYFRDCGLDVSLSKEASWASIRDKVELGLLDAAQMPAGIPLAAALGLGYGHNPLVCTMGLGLNGNAITLSSALHEALQQAPGFATDPAAAGAALAWYLRENPQERPTFATVYTHSMHSFLLRYWLNACGIDLQRIRQVVVPPPQMVDALKRGLIDAFCAGEPWNSIAQQQKVGQVLISGHQIWNNAPDKVLGTTAHWVSQHPNCLQLLIMALLRACAWLDEPGNRGPMLEILSRPHYLGCDLITPDPGIGRHQFFGSAANFPWQSQARWLLEQIQQDLPASRSDAALDLLARSTYDSTHFRRACTALKLNLPLDDSKPEGMHDSPWEVAGHQGPLRLPRDRRFSPGIRGTATEQ